MTNFFSVLLNSKFTCVDINFGFEIFLIYKYELQLNEVLVIVYYIAIYMQQLM